MRIRYPAFAAAPALGRTASPSRGRYPSMAQAGGTLPDKLPLTFVGGHGSTAPHAPLAGLAGK